MKNSMINVMNNDVTDQHIMPAGKYYVGDPCYVISNENWIPFLENVGYFGTHTKADNGDIVVNWYEGLFSYNFRTCFAHNTAWGDGIYQLVEDHKIINEIWVDAGVISIMPFDAIDDKERAFACGAVYEFDKPFNVQFVDGRFIIGNLKIETS